MKRFALGFMTVCLTMGLSFAAYAHCGGCGTGAKKDHAHTAKQKCKEKCAKAEDKKACKEKCRDKAKEKRKAKKEAKK